MAGLSVADPPVGGDNGGDASAALVTATTVAIMTPRTGTRATGRQDAASSSRERHVDPVDI